MIQEDTTVVHFVLGFAFNHDKTKLLLIKKNRPQWQAGLYNGIGGKIESFDQSPVAAMVREFKEECGLDTTCQQWIEYTIVDNCFFHMTCFTTVLDDFEHYQSITDEIVYSVGLSDLIKNNFNNCISNLPHLIDQAIISSFPILNT